MLTVGQQLWCVPRDKRRGPYEVTIEKIGRKWATLDEWDTRINIETLSVDGGRDLSQAQCYLSREEWEDEVKINEAYSKLRSAIGYGNPCKGVTLDDIRRVVDILRIG